MRSFDSSILSIDLFKNNITDSVDLNQSTDGDTYQQGMHDLYRNSTEDSWKESVAEGFI